MMDDGRYKATWNREFQLPWREHGPPIISMIKLIRTSRLSKKNSLMNDDNHFTQGGGDGVK